MPSQVTLREGIRSRAQAMGGHSLVGLPLWVYHYNEQEPVEPQQAKGEGAGEGEAEAGASNCQLGIWDHVGICGYDARTGEHVVAYMDPEGGYDEGSSWRMLLPVNFIHFGDKPAGRGKPHCREPPKAGLEAQAEHTMETLTSSE